MPFRWLVVELTSACNHRCAHCYNYWAEDRSAAAARRSLTRPEIREIVRGVQAVSALEQVALSGGEPLLRHDAPEIACDLAALGLSVVVISNLATLGTALARRFPPRTVFEMTLFSADEALHDRIAGRPGAFRRTLDGAIAAHAAGHGLALSIVVSALNAHDVERTARLGVAMGVEAILINRVNLTPRIVRHRADLVPTRGQLRRALAEADALASRCDTRFAVSIPTPPCLIDTAGLDNLHFGYCPRGGADAYYTVGVDGGLRPCNHSSVVLGDLRTRSFRDIVRSDLTRSFWRPVPEVCRACRHPEARQCKGGCPAAADECYGTRRLPDPVVALTAS